MIQPKIIRRNETKLIGMKMSMNLVQNNVGQLWQKFMPVKHLISNRIGDDLISLAEYPADYFLEFSPQTNFVRWAGVEVSSYVEIPDGFGKLVIPEELYAVFHYRGSSADPGIFQYIYGVWLPQSGYELVHAPHFEVLGAKYQNNSPDSEEDIFIPIQKKAI